MLKFILVITILINVNLFGQTIVTDNDLIINHGDITLYLTKDTCVLASKHVIKYCNFLKLDSERDNKWFQDKFKGKYNKTAYYKSGYDIGHLTPSHITSYDNVLNHNSFSLFNAAPQIPSLNRGKWAGLENDIEDTIAKYRKNAIIITGVIYDVKNKNYLGKSKIPIPIYYFKIVYINRKKYCWVGSNINGQVIPVSLRKLNYMFKLNGMSLILK